MASQRWTKGALLEVTLTDGSRVTAQMLDEPEFAFFDPADRDNVLFRLWVHKSAYTNGRWLKIGKAALRSELERAIPRFKQDPINSSLSIYVDGEEKRATKEECRGLERASVWDPEHVESRLLDYKNGVKNVWVKSLELREDA